MNESFLWYQTLTKPSWAPPSWVFGPVWSTLYTVIAISYGYTFYLFFTKKIPTKVLLPFVLNLIFNFAFTPIQFGLQNNILAFVDIILVDVTLIWALFVIFRHAKWVTYVNLPYLGWCLFATVLQATITFLNW